MLGIYPGESLDWALFPATTHRPSPVVSFFQELLAEPAVMDPPSSCRSAAASPPAAHEVMHDVPKSLLHYTANHDPASRVYVEGEEVEEYGWGKAKRD